MARPAPAVGVLALLALASIASAQPTARIVANVPLLVKYPGFYHLKSIIVRGELVATGTQPALFEPDGDQNIKVTFTENQPDDGLVELRGIFWDVGRMTAEEPRLAGFDVQPYLDAHTSGRWPAQGELLVVRVSEATRAEPPPAPSVRSVVLDPARYVLQKITLTGTFRGNNLYGDLPRSPAIGKWDFVLRSANAALWVTGLRPKGRGFDLDPRAKVDTGRLLEVSGVVRVRDGLVWMEAAAITAPSVTAVQPVDEPAEVIAAPAVPVPAPEVTFSLPTEGETDVSPSILVQVQVSRNLDPGSLKDRVRLSYVDASLPGAPPPAPILFAASYRAADRVVQIRLEKPLEPFRTVKVELLEGIKGPDGQPLAPFSLTFTTGSQ